MISNFGQKPTQNKLLSNTENETSLIDQFKQLDIINNAESTNTTTLASSNEKNNEFINNLNQLLTPKEALEVLTLLKNNSSNIRECSYKALKIKNAILEIQKTDHSEFASYEHAVKTLETISKQCPISQQLVEEEKKFSYFSQPYMNNESSLFSQPSIKNQKTHEISGDENYIDTINHYRLKTFTNSSAPLPGFSILTGYDFNKITKNLEKLKPGKNDSVADIESKRQLGSIVDPDIFFVTLILTQLRNKYENNEMLIHNIYLSTFLQSTNTLIRHNPKNDDNKTQEIILDLYRMAKIFSANQLIEKFSKKDILETCHNTLVKYAEQLYFIKHHSQFNGYPEKYFEIIQNKLEDILTKEASSNEYLIHNLQLIIYTNPNDYSDIYIGNTRYIDGTKIKANGLDESSKKYFYNGVLANDFHNFGDGLLKYQRGLLLSGLSETGLFYHKGELFSGEDSKTGKVILDGKPFNGTLGDKVYIDGKIAHNIIHTEFKKLGRIMYIDGKIDYSELNKNFYNYFKVIIKELENKELKEYGELSNFNSLVAVLFLRFLNPQYKAHLLYNKKIENAAKSINGIMEDDLFVTTIIDFFRNHKIL